MNPDMPLTLPWLLHKRERKTRTATCKKCGVIFRHGKSWNYDCHECVSAEMDQENAKGLAVALGLNLPDFAMYRRYGYSEIFCSWKCEDCSKITSSPLHKMESMTAWKSACNICKKQPRYERLKKFKEKNIYRLAKRLDVKVANIQLPERLPVDNKTFVVFACNICGWNKTRTLSELKRGRVCPCRDGSAGEIAIAAFLSERGVSFKREVSLLDLDIPLGLRFDFYIPSSRLAIEYDGIQHFKAVPYFGGSKALEQQKKNDQLKNEAALEAGIKLHRIPYHCEDITGEVYRILEGNNVY